MCLLQIKAKPEHNGKTGRLAAIDAVSGRWEVRMAGGASLRVRAANLVKRRGSSRGAGWASAFKMRVRSILTAWPRSNYIAAILMMACVST